MAEITRKTISADRLIITADGHTRTVGRKITLCMQENEGLGGIQHIAWVACVGRTMQIASTPSDAEQHALESFVGLR